jgi:hypothetical protein
MPLLWVCVLRIAVRRRRLRRAASCRGQFGALRCEGVWLHPIQTVEFIVGHDNHDLSRGDSDGWNGTLQ